MARSRVPAAESAGPSARREPQQRRSREIVRAILEAARRLLEEDGPSAVTTNRIAERAGVSIGSLYRYFPNKDAVLSAVYDSDTRREARELEGGDWELTEEPLEDALRAVVDFQLERHRRLLEMEGDFYRSHHRAFSLARRIGEDAVEARIAHALASHGDRVRVGDVEQAAFLLARGVSAILRSAVEERPGKLYEPAFREALIDMVSRYVVRGPATR